MITVRRAIQYDAPWLLVQLRAFDRFFGTHRSLFPDLASAEQQLLQLMDPNGGCFFVATEGAMHLGFVVGALHPQLYNRSIRQLTELFWWVAPEHRRSSAGARLLMAFEAYGRAHADFIVMTLEAKSPVNPRSLERRGFRLQESSYLLEVDG